MLFSVRGHCELDDADGDTDVFVVCTGADEPDIGDRAGCKVIANEVEAVRRLLDDGSRRMLCSGLLANLGDVAIRGGNDGITLVAFLGVSFDVIILPPESCSFQ